ncbi:hypothetical protein EVAR_101614_1 [Eumeta japonica]|uniref:Uncharacterized protein n=1 Tax=Eumeta variegata TaxID=151549 RepID=A0A4C1SR14_EUMVA|nr:hypothetical protein EVAR_101614_1 [Eumeta japonica]
MARFGGRHLGDGFYEEPEWWPEYLRIEREESDHGEGSVDARELWAHIFENWRRAVLPDLQRFYPRLPAENEHELLALPWRSLREVILSPSASEIHSPAARSRASGRHLRRTCDFEVGRLLRRPHLDGVQQFHQDLDAVGRKLTETGQRGEPPRSRGRGPHPPPAPRRTRRGDRAYVGIPAKTGVGYNSPQ